MVNQTLLLHKPHPLKKNLYFRDLSRVLPTGGLSNNVVDDFEIQSQAGIS
jgi:hypothetical protein